MKILPQDVDKKSASPDQILEAKVLFMTKNYSNLSKDKQKELSSLHNTALASKLFELHFTVKGEVVSTSKNLTSVLPKMGRYDRVNEDSPNLVNMERLAKLDLDLFLIEDPLDLRPRMQNALQHICRQNLTQNHPFTTLFLGSKFNFPDHHSHDPIYSAEMQLAKQNANSSQQNFIKFSDSRLDSSQKQAVTSSLSDILSSYDDNKNITVIHGPPGTGKTSVIAELVYQLAINQNLKVFLCAHSNQAVDNILEKVEKNIRKGGLKNPNSEVNQHDQKLVNYQIEKNLKQICRINPVSLQAKRKYEKLKPHQHKMVFSTLHAAANELLKDTRNQKSASKSEELERLMRQSGMKTSSDAVADAPKFDVTIIDEAGQNFDVDCLAAISMSSHLVLAGDHLQLAPLLMTDEFGSSHNFYELSGLQTIQERAVNVFNAEQSILDVKNSEEGQTNSKISKILLDTQYRMNDQIMRWSNQFMYENSLKSGEKNENWTVSDKLPPVAIS